MNKLKQFFLNRVIPFIGRLFVCRNRFVNVIYFHDVVEGEGETLMRINRKTFFERMEYLLSQGYKTLRFDDLADPTALSFGPKKILIAFDDGWKSNDSLIFEWMKERGIKYNVFLTIGEIGVNPEYLDWERVREMYGSGICGFGVHTFSHADMSDMSKVDTAMEIDKANDVFEKELGFEPCDFCYPYGYCSESSHRWLIAHTDYRRIYTSAPFYSYTQEGRIIFSRQGVSNDDSARDFCNKIKGYMNVYKPFFERYYKIFK